MNLADRLKPYQVPHQLIHRLEKYQATTPAVSIFRGQSWKTLAYWSMLLDEDDEGIAELIIQSSAREKAEQIRSLRKDYLPTPEEWFGRVGV